MNRAALPFHAILLFLRKGDIKAKAVIAQFFWNISNNAVSEKVIPDINIYIYIKIFIHLMRQICKLQNTGSANDFGVPLNSIIKK